MNHKFCKKRVFMFEIILCMSIKKNIKVLICSENCFNQSTHSLYILLYILRKLLFYDYALICILYSPREFCFIAACRNYQAAWTLATLITTFFIKMEIKSAE